MNLKRLLIRVVLILVILTLGGFFLVRSWSSTPYGRLDWRVAAYLKLTGSDKRGELEKDMPVEESRKRMAEKAASVTGEPVAMASVKDMTAKAGKFAVPVRVYTPEAGGPFPAVIFYHGGGWVQGSVETHDGLCRIIAKKAGAVVVSVDYRLAPEHVYPAAVDDCYTALLWVSVQGKLLNIDQKKIAVAGDSAGGNLAAVVCLMARDRKGPRVAFQALIYPGVDSANLNTESYTMFGKGFMLDKVNVERFIGMYLPDGKDRKNPYASPLLAASHRDLPPALVITAGFDVLRDEGEAYAKKLADSGVRARSLRIPGVIHGFVSAPRLLPQSGQATDEIAAALRQAFAAR